MQPQHNQAQHNQTPNTRGAWVRVGVTVAAVVYPFAVYALMGRVPLWAFFALGLLAGGVRLYALRGTPAFAFWAGGAAVAAAGLVALFFVDAMGAVQAYPVVVSLAFALVFAVSLRHPPCVVERIARLSEPDLSPAGVRYARKVSWVWLGFLLLNAGIAAATILWGTLAQWALWTGFLSYVAMGILFAGEYLIRKMVRP